MESWADSILCLVDSRCKEMSFELDGPLERTLLLGWHFPEYPALLEEVVRRQVLVLVASEEPWMAPLRERGCLCSFRPRLMRSTLIRAFAAGRTIFAMLDHCYEETRHAVAPFLSYPSKTPVGVVQLAQRFGYRLGLLTSRGATVKLLHSARAEEATLQQHAERINRLIEEEILRRPARWLMWPSVDRRWIGVDYAL